MVVKPPPAQFVGRWTTLQEVEGSSPTEQNSTSISVFTEPTFLSSSAQSKHSNIVPMFAVIARKNISTKIEL